MASSSASTGASSTVTSSYQYDVDGNRTYEGYVASGTYTDWYLNIVIPYSITHQNATVAWDAVNRMTSFTDTGTAAPATITWKYDKAGNVRNVNAVHRTLDAQGVVSTTTTTDDYWYLYDAMNRFTTTKGQLSGGVISRGLSGMDIGYDAAGQRTSMAKTMMTSVYDSMFGFTTYTWWEQKELYTYTADGYLAQTNVAAGAASYTINDPTPPAVAAATGSGTQLATMVRDAMGRVTTYTEYQPNGTTVAYSRAATYNSKSEASSDTVTVLRGSDTWVYNTTYYYDSTYNGSGTYQGGVVTKQVVTITKNGVAQTGNNTTNTYVWWDGALQNVSTYVSGATTNTSTFYYNDSGYLQSVYIQDGRPRTVSFISDGNNLILQRDEADNQSTGDPRELYYYFNGMRVGDIGNNGTSDTDYVGSVSTHTVAAGTGPFRNGSAYSTQFADFDQSYDPINGLNYQSTSSRYTVQEGDTLESIALQLWGDASFWYMIADANGLSGSETLVAGQTLRIPNKVHNAHNTNDVYKVYDPNEAIGDVSPTAGTPAAKPKGGCGILGQILSMIIAVVVAIVMPELLPMLGEVLSGMITAAAVSVVSQGVSIAVGIQDKFSFKAVALAAVTGGVGKGLDRAGVFGKLGIAGEGFGAQFAQGALTNATTQGIAVATGLQHKFSFAGVAAAGIVQGVGNEVFKWATTEVGKGGLGLNGSRTADGRHFNDPGQGALALGLKGMAGGIAGAATRSLINGSNFGDNLIAVLPDVIGSTVGSALGDAVADSEFGKSISSAFDAVGDLLGFDGEFGFDGVNGPDGKGRELSLSGLGHSFKGVFDAIGDTLGFDGHFGYQGAEGRSISLGEPGDAVARTFEANQGVLTEDVGSSLLYDGAYWRSDSVFGSVFRNPDSSGFTQIVFENKLAQYARFVDVTFEFVSNAKDQFQLGKEGEIAAREYFERQGVKILGEQVYIDTSYGFRVQDFLLEGQDGVAFFAEIKVNSATRSKTQLLKDLDIFSHGGQIASRQGFGLGYGYGDIIPPTPIIQINVIKDGDVFEFKPEYPGPTAPGYRLEK